MPQIETKYKIVDVSSPNSVSSSAYDAGYAGAERTAPVNGVEKFFGDVYDWADNALTGDLQWRREALLNEINNAFNASEAQKNRDFNAEQARLAWERSEKSAFNAYNRQKELAQNEYSYRISDLRKNGINPYVALGQGASVPGTPAGSAYSASGSSASSAGAHASPSGQGVASALASIIVSAFRLASSSDTPHSYTDTYIDKYGEIKGYRTRSY